MPAECPASQPAKPACVQGQLPLGAQQGAGCSESPLWQLGKSVGVGWDREEGFGRDWSNQREELLLLENCSPLTVLPGARPCLLAHHGVGGIRDS